MYGADKTQVASPVKAASKYVEIAIIIVVTRMVEISHFEREVAVKHNKQKW